MSSSAKRHRRSPLGMLVTGVLLVGATLAQTATATFQSQYCNTNNPQPYATMTREGAKSWGAYAVGEGYQWGGGCWNIDDVDSTPSDPPGTYSGGEGPDCSGFVWKTWRESRSTTNGSIYLWERLNKEHGPYNSGAYQAGTGTPNTTVVKASATTMDAFASSGHIGMIWATQTSGSDLILEAKGESYGTSIWSRTYRGDSNYGGARRVGWTG